MADKSSLINRLLDVIEDLLIENRAYVSTIKHFAPGAREVADTMIRTAKSDPVLRKMIRSEFAPFRDQSPEEALQELLKKLETKDVN